MFETKQLKPGVYFGRTLRRTNRRDVKVCVANRTNRPQLITSGKCLVQPAYVTLLPSEGEQLNQLAPKHLLASSSLHWKSFLNISRINSGNKWWSICCKTMRMSFLTLVEHSIDTGQHRMIRNPFVDIHVLIWKKSIDK